MDEVEIVHVPPVAPDAAHVGDVVVDPRRIEHPDVLRNLVADVHGLRHELLAGLHVRRDRFVVGDGVELLVHTPGVLLVGHVMDLAEEKLRNGTASSQLITELVKRGSAKARLEQELLARQTELAAAKAEAIKSAARMEELYEKAMKAMKRYGGQFDDEEVDEDDFY